MSDREPSSPPAGTNTTRSAADFDALADRLRSRVDLFGKSLAGLATVGTGAVGLNTVSDLGPRGEGHAWVAVAAVGGLLLAAVCAIVVAGRLMQVNQPVVVEVEDAEDLHHSEPGFDDASAQLDLERIFSSTAQRYGHTTLPALAARERDLRRAAAEASSEKERDRRLALAHDIQADIDEALARARWAVVRRRASDAAGGSSALRLYSGVAAGLLVFALLSDVATANQDDDIATAKACGEAREAGALDGDLRGTTCLVAQDEDTDDGPAAEDDRATVSKDAALAQVAGQLLDVLDACYDLAGPAAGTDPEQPLAVTDCDTVRAALQEMLGAVQAADEDEPAS